LRALAENNPDAPCQFAPLPHGNQTRDMHLATGRYEYSRQHFDRCAFPRAIGPDETNHLTAFHMQREVLDRLYYPHLWVYNTA
jgi:hypothetical protein